MAAPARVDIIHEQETTHGWVFQARLRDATVAGREVVVRLSWADYNLWSPDGADRPEHVALGALRFLLSREPAAEVAGDFDLARLRRRHADTDALIPTFISAA